MKIQDQEPIKFKNWTCFLELAYYNTKDRLAIQLISAEENPKENVMLGEPIAKATINLPDVYLADNEIIIKSYSENEGVLESLQMAGLISQTIRQVQTGFSTASIVEKTDKLIALEKKLKRSM